MISRQYCAVRQRKVRRSSGFTLIELMIVVAIVAILAAIAYPAYQEQILKTKRSVAQGALLEIAARQEQHFLDNRTYTDDLSDLGYAASTIYFDSNRSPVAAASSDRIYAVSVQTPDGGCPIVSCYVLQAVPQGSQASDTKCGTLTLSSRGEKSATGTRPTSCW